MQIKKNVVLITGGGSGIGLALAKMFIKEENKVIITGRDKEKLESVKSKIAGIITEVCDVTDRNAIKMLSEKYRDINIIINNAGIHNEYVIDDGERKASLFEDEIKTNLLGPAFVVHYFLPALRNKKEAAIINVTSYFGFAPKPSAPGYSASKAGFHSLTKSLRSQLINTNIKVFEVAPPIVDTAMTASKKGLGAKKMQPDEVAHVLRDGLINNKYEMYPGLSKKVYLLNRIAPKFTEKKIRQISN